MQMQMETVSTLGLPLYVLVGAKLCSSRKLLYCPWRRCTSDLCRNSNSTGAFNLQVVVQKVNGHGDTKQVEHYDMVEARSLC